MIRSIVTKLWVAIFLIVIVLLLLFSIILSSSLEKIYYSHEIDQMREHSKQWAQILKEDSASHEDIQNKLEFWGRLNHYQITIFDTNKVVRFSSNIKLYPQGKKLNWLANRDIGSTNYIYSEYHPNEGKDMTAVFQPVTMNSGDKFAIMTHTSSHQLQEMNQTIKKVTLILLVIFIIFGAIMVMLLSKWLATPLIKIKKAAMNIAKGDFDVNVDLKREDELGDLAQTINNLAERLKRTIRTLHNTNNELNDLLVKWKDFLTDVSHELRTPLFLISGYSEAIMEGVIDRGKAEKEYLPIIHKETLRLQKLVEDLTKVEKITQLEIRQVSLKQIIYNTMKPFQIILKESHITLKVSPDISRLTDISLDPDRFSEVIFNLVDNAIRHTPPGGTISITAYEKESKVLTLQISDTGVGISAKHLPSLFQRFYRVDKARSRVHGGSGLGLAIVKKIIEQHDGTISVKSNVDKGTTFTIKIPI